MALDVVLWGVLTLFATGAAAVAGARRGSTSTFVYAVALVVSMVALCMAVWTLLVDPAATPTVRLPIGLPWLGAHFRLDALAAAFLVVGLVALILLPERPLRGGSGQAR